jgi:hypothetical protein
MTARKATAIAFLLAFGALPATALAGPKMTPQDFLARFLAVPMDAVTDALLSGKPKPKPKAALPADTPLVDVPMPHLRPADDGLPETLGYLPDPATETAPAPLPRVRPASAAVGGPFAPLPKLSRPPPAAQSTCGVSLAKLGVEASALAPIEEGECGIAAPVAVAAFDGGRVDFSTKAIVDCRLAERLATWVKDTLEPKVRQAYGEDLTGLRIAASYACRNRDGLADAKLSEHAHGNAVDISAFRVGKRWIEVGSGWTGGGDDADFLADVRKSACGPFTTVLGPGSDEFHSDHFHLDMIERRTAGPSKGLYCE